MRRERYALPEGTRFSLLLDLGRSSHFDRAAVALVVRVADGHTDVHIAAAKVQIVIGASVYREPVALLDVLAIGAEPREDILVILADDVRNGLAVGHDDLQVLVIDPNAALKITLLLLNDLGGDVENIRRKVVHLLTTHVGDVVLGKLGGGENERLHIANVVVILFAHGDASERIHGSEGDVLDALAFRSEDDVAGFAVLAVGPTVIVESLDGESLRVGVVVAFALELRFALGEVLDNFIDRLGRRFVGDGIVRRADDALGWGSRVIGRVRLGFLGTLRLTRGGRGACIGGKGTGSWAGSVHDQQTAVR